MRLRDALVFCLMALALPSCLSQPRTLPPGGYPFIYHSMSTLQPLSEDGPTGPQSHGFALALTANGRMTSFLAPVWVTAELRNLTPTGRSVDVAFYHVVIKNSLTGDVLKQRPETYENSLGPTFYSGPMCGHWMDAFSSRYRNLRLDSAYYITGPGIYSIQAIDESWVNCKHVILQSNTITVLLF